MHSLSPSTVWVFAALISIWGALALFKTSSFANRSLQYFRVLFPSWRFFDELENSPVLYYRYRLVGRELGPWQLGLQKSRRGPGALLVNPEGNYLFAAHSLLEQLIADLEEFPDSKSVEGLVSFGLTRNLVEYQIRSRERVTDFTYQFKICAKNPVHASESDLLITQSYESKS